MFTLNLLLFENFLFPIDILPSFHPIYYALMYLPAWCYLQPRQPWTWSRDKMETMI